MAEYACDLHIHSCLSPCGDDLMTPPNIVNMAYVKGLDIIALTDHNSARNVRAAIKAAEGLPLTVIPGMEVTTAEEIHLVCLFPDADRAEAASAEVEKLLPKIENRPEYFGRQLITDEQENVLGEFPWLLPNALSLSIDELPALVESFGGFCFPAHIDKSSTSLLSVFGFVPENLHFTAVEIHRADNFFADEKNLHYRQEYRVIHSSDAHCLEDISEREFFLELREPSFAALKEVLSKG